MLRKLLCCALLCELACIGGSIAANLRLTTIVDCDYYPDLPIYVSFSVTNIGSDPVWVNSVGRGSPWVRPAVVRSEGKESVELCSVAGVRWREGVELQVGAAMSGRIDITDFLSVTQAGTKELLPGKYELILYYQYGSNLTDYVQSMPQSFCVYEPGPPLEKSRRDFKEMRQAVISSTSLEPTYLISPQGNVADPYVLALRACYARWLSRKARFNDALDIWKDIMQAGNTIATDSLETKEEIARCYIGLKRLGEARSILSEIEAQSDIAYGTLRILDRQSTCLPIRERNPALTNETSPQLVRPSDKVANSSPLVVPAKQAQMTKGNRIIVLPLLLVFTTVLISAVVWVMRKQ